MYNVGIGLKMIIDKITDLVYANGTQSYSYNSLLKHTDCKYRQNKNINKSTFIFISMLSARVPGSSLFFVSVSESSVTSVSLNAFYNGHKNVLKINCRLS